MAIDLWKFPKNYVDKYHPNNYMGEMVSSQTLFRQVVTNMLFKTILGG